MYSVVCYCVGMCVSLTVCDFFFFKQKTAYEVRISDWSSDVCSSDLYAKWAMLYSKATGNRVNYQSIGSGGGQQQIIAKTVDFGASDDPMKGDALEKNGLFQFPAVDRKSTRLNSSH